MSSYFVIYKSSTGEIVDAAPAAAQVINGLAEGLAYRFKDYDTLPEIGVVDASLMLSSEEQIAKLLSAATAYQNAYADASGITAITSYYSAFELLAFMGKTISCPEVSGNYAWYASLWAEYKTRKQAILAGQAVAYDFSALGLPPYSITDMTTAAEAIKATLKEGL